MFALSEQRSKNFSNSLRTENEPCENREFVAFAFNERKNEQKKNYKEILKNNPEIYSIIEERNNLINELLKQKEYTSKIENQLKETVDAYKTLSQKNQQLTTEHKAGLQSINPLKERIAELEAEFSQYEENVKAAATEYTKKSKDAYNQRLAEIEQLKQENQQLRQGRGAAGLLADKTKINALKEKIAELEKVIEKKNEKNKDLKRRLDLAGRPAIPKDTITKIVKLYKDGYGYGRISELAGTSKSTVSKYITRHLRDSRAKDDGPVIHINN